MRDYTLIILLKDLRGYLMIDYLRILYLMIDYLRILYLMIDCLRILYL